MVTRPPRGWRTTSMVLAVASLLLMAGAMAVLVAVFQGIGALESDPAAKRSVAVLAVVAGVLLIFALFCTLLLVMRYLFGRLHSMQGRHAPTEYVDAWKIAGQRLEVPEEDSQDPDEPSA